MADYLAFGSGDMTIEGWVYPNTLSGSDTFFDTRQGGSSFGADAFAVGINSGIISVAAGSYSAVTAVATHNTALSVNTWTHIAFTRESGNNRLFINGILVTQNTTSWNQTYTAGRSFYIGQTVGFDRPFDGYISDFRMVKGTAVYTSNFTPPAAPVGNTNASLYLPMDNVGIFDKTSNNTLTLVGNPTTSTTQTKFADTSIYFDGSNDTIEIPNGTGNNPKLLFNNSNWTMEAWVYKTSAVNAHIFSQSGVSTLSSGGTGALQLQIFRGGNRVLFASATGLINVNTWHHVALTCDGSDYRIFLDGTQVATAGISASYPWSQGVTTQPFVIGRYTYNNTNYWPGYMENIQLNPNVCKYTTTFTPPDATQGRIYQAES
jgi:hypothetical protein